MKGEPAKPGINLPSRHSMLGYGMNRPAIISSLTAAVAAFIAGRYFPVFPEPAAKRSGASVIAGAAETTSRSAPMVDAKPAVSSPASPPATSPRAIPSAEKLMGMLEEIAGSREPNARERVLAEWLASDPEGALSFLSTSPQRDSLLKMMTALWAKSDPAAASAWLAAHTAFDGRDAMAAGLASGVMKEDPQAAIEWAASIKDPAIKINAAGETGYEFYRQSDSAGDEAFTGMGLPASAKEAVTAAWNRKLTAISRRNAQNLVSTYSASRAAGASIDASSVEHVRALHATGVKGSGQFASSTFQVNSKDLTDREVAAAGTHMELSEGGSLKYREN